MHIPVIGSQLKINILELTAGSHFIYYQFEHRPAPSYLGYYINGKSKNTHADQYTIGRQL
jgi:hypothetical protein